MFKNGTFNFCWEMGLRANVDRSKGIRQILYIGRLDGELRLRTFAPLKVAIIGLPQFDPEYDLLEDARLIHNGKEVVMTTNYVPAGGPPGTWPRQAEAWPLIGLLDLSNNSVSLRPAALDGTRPPQKNWIPFGTNGETFLQYSIAPHRILRADPRTGRCEDAWVSGTRHHSFPEKSDFKGGAPLIDVGGRLLGACHSWSLNKHGEREYVTYLYLARPVPPHDITHMSPPLKILMPDRVQYLMAMVLSEPDNCVTLSYGVNDCDNYFVKVPLTRILGPLEPSRRAEAA